MLTASKSSSKSKLFFLSKILLELINGSAFLKVISTNDAFVSSDSLGVTWYESES